MRGEGWGEGDGAAKHSLDAPNHLTPLPSPLPSPLPQGERGSNRAHEIAGDHETVRGILKSLNIDDQFPHSQSDRIDSVVLHPVLGPILLVAVLFLMFQAVFAWAVLPMDAIKSATEWFGASLGPLLPEGWIRSLVVDGIIAGLGGVVVFLPQILILFFFILILEESGYLPRAAFLLDRVMTSVGLSGRSFIPLLSSFACAVPGIMAARSISNARDRWVTIVIALLMTCSARLPVYALAATGADTAQALSPIIAKSWSLATAFSLLAWFVFAPQCMSTLITVKRESGGWKMPILMASYLFALAYAASFVTYRVTLALTS